jgi:hypothetical protein
MANWGWVERLAIASRWESPSSMTDATTDPGPDSGTQHHPTEIPLLIPFPLGNNAVDVETLMKN